MFRHADVCVLCVSCDSSQCCILHDLQNRSHECLIGRHECLLLFTPVAVSAFIICSGLCACTEML